MMGKVELSILVLSSADLARSVAFYRQCFDAPLIVDTPVYKELRLWGGQRLGLYQQEGFCRNTGQPVTAAAAGTTTTTELYFHVAEPAALIARLTASGATLLSPMRRRDWHDEAAYLADPDGNVLVVAARGDTAGAGTRYNLNLKLPHCTLRDWRRSDRESLVRHADNSAIADNLRDGFPHPYTAADAERFFSLCENLPQCTFFAITVADQAVGGIGLSLHTDIERISAELGYWLGESFWGRGIVTEAVAALTDWAFATLPLERIYALPFAYNLASTRVLEKAGYQLEGRLRSNAIKRGKILDQLMYARLRG